MATMREVIDGADREYRNGIDRERKRSWLCDLDRTIRDTVIGTHEGEWMLRPYTQEDEDRELICDDRQVYVKYLIAQIDLANAEIERYNNNAAVFERALDNWVKAYHRWHMPRMTRMRVF